MDSSSPATVPPPSPLALWIAGLRFAVGLGAPLLLGAWFDRPFAGGFAALGAMFALGSDTRRTVAARLGGIGFALLLLGLAAMLGSSLRGNPALEWGALALIVFLTGLPGPRLAYLGFVGKFAATAMVLVAAGFPASLEAGAAILAGGAWAAAITAVDAWIWRSHELGTRPLSELATVFGGEVNSPLYAAMLAATVLAGTLTAKQAGAVEPGWVGLTVLFVMHVNDSQAFRRIGERIAGTLAGFALVIQIVPAVDSLWGLSMLVVVAAFFFPVALARNYFVFSAVVTVLILLLIDLLLAAHGGDLGLLRWRVYDTVLGAGWATVGLLLMRAIRWLRSAGQR